MFNGRQSELSDEILQSDGFWGDISIEEFQKSRAIPLQIPFELVKEALIYAVLSLEIDLKEVEDNYKAQGIQHISELNSGKVNGINYPQQLYKKAVFARAKNELLPEFFTLSARQLHEKRDLVSEQKSLQAEAVMAIRALKGKTRGSVQLV